MQKALSASEEKEERMRQENEFFKKRMESLGKVNQEQRHKVEELNSLLKRLGLEKDEDDAEISERDYESFRSIFQNCIDAIKAKPKPKKKVIRIEFSVENNFSLQKLLDDLDERENKDNSFLLRDLSFHKDKHFHASKLIVDWVIKFGAALDEGGPTKHFFSEVWAQLETLKVHAFGVEVELFEESPVGAMPTSDEKLRCEGIKNIEPDVVEIIVGKAKRYYRAIGRIMFHSLVRGFVVSSTAMPRFYRNVIFRECDLQDSRYKHMKVIKDLDTTGYKLSEMYDDLDEDSSEIFITKTLHDQFIVLRSIAINSLKEGLTLDGYADLSVVLRTMPEKAISDLLFAPPDTNVADVFKVFKPIFSIDGIEQEQISDNQKFFFEKIFKIVIREKTEEDSLFLPNFLCFVTALTFLPHSLARPGYEILVEFHSSIDGAEARPESKTCANALILPGHAYNCDKELFVRLLTESLFEMKENNFSDD